LVDHEAMACRHDGRRDRRGSLARDRAHPAGTVSRVLDGRRVPYRPRRRPQRRQQPIDLRMAAAIRVVGWAALGDAGRGGPRRWDAPRAHRPCVRRGTHRGDHRGTHESPRVTGLVDRSRRVDRSGDRRSPG
jgi:hypothetical protein